MENFVPSYSNEAERLEIRKQKDRKDMIRNIIVAIIAIIVISGVCISIYALSTKKYRMYEKYESKMNIYGFTKVYDNTECTTSQKVKKAEAIKMVLSCTYNVSDIEGIAVGIEETYPNSIWVEYAKKQGIVGMDEITAENAQEPVKYQEVLVWFYNVKTKILDIQPNTEQLVNVKDINAYNADQKLAINDLINNNIIVESTKRINGNKKMYKGQLNELVINFAEEYNTITVGDAKLNINADKIPTNVSMYPYTLASVLKETYEIPFINEGKERFISPINFYPDNKEYYAQVKSFVENYYKYLINVNYENISVEQMNRNLKKYALNELDKDAVEDYVDYVKRKKIKLTGTATVQLPCVYFDGEVYRVRTKLNFKIESSTTDENILYYDNEYGDVNYSSKEYEIYIDAVLSKNEVSESLFNEERAICTMLSKPTSTIVSRGE